MDYDEQRAEAYDRRHASRFAEAEATATFLAGQARAAAEAGGDSAPRGPLRALELGIGTGRLAIPLAALGLEVHGIDSSPPMIDRLRAKPGSHAIGVGVGDFSEPATLVEGPFALVFVAFNSLFELPDQDAQARCIAGAAGVLAPGGRFVVEALAPDLTRLDQSLTVVARSDDEVVLQATSHDPFTQVVTGHDVVLAPAGTRLVPWSIRYASVPEVDLMARLAGLVLVERHGGWGGEPFVAASHRHVSVYAAPTP